MSDTCEYKGCTSKATRTMTHSPNTWIRKTCVTHQLDFQAGAIRYDAQELCELWDSGNLKADRPLFGVAYI